jgi:hypothetical protein
MAKIEAELIPQPLPVPVQSRLEGLSVRALVQAADGDDETEHVLRAFVRAPAPDNERVEIGAVHGRGRDFTTELALEPIEGEGIHRLELELDGGTGHYFQDVTI